MSENIELRPSVAAFARRMEETLRKHDAKKGGQQNWRKDSPYSLVDRIDDELDELLSASGAEEKAAECVDIANFCLMAYDVLVGLPDDETL